MQLIALVNSARIPLATYRLQFNSRFSFRDAHAIVDYLKALGISDCYASSYLKAVPGSSHGYDVVDPTKLNAEIGTDEEYWTWIRALKERGMGHVIDVVPNHMGIARSANPWWLDVLENGPSSRFARFFDIEWHPVKDELADKLLIPILGDQYGAALERQELTLLYRDGAFAVQYGDNWLPIAPDTYPRILSPTLDEWLADHAEEIDPADADELRSILTGADNLPPRGSRAPEAITVRAREKEVVKRRLAAVLDRSRSLRALVDATLHQYRGIVGQPRSFDLLDALLNEQSYRLAHWRVASEEINYRRFFDVNELAALRMEDPDVFEEVHRFIFELVARGAATGLRVDHVDGLFAPGDYLRRLQARAAAALDVHEPADRSMFLVVEKILGRGEQLPAEWPVHGTTGYEFAAVVNGLFVDARHERAFDDIYARFIRERRERAPFDDLVYRSKKLVMHETMSGDVNSLGHQLNRFSERHRHFRDFTLYSFISTLKEVIACFPVYRTYVVPDEPVSERDRRYIAQAIRCAKRRALGISSVVFDFVERLLVKQTAVSTREDCEEQNRFIGKFQQITSPITAKAIEDRVMYLHNRLLSLNEVGSDPTRFGIDRGAVHQWMADRSIQWPTGLSTTSTHDTKRGEDVRARLNVLSEIPGEWKSAVTKWRALNRRLKPELHGVPAPNPNEEYFIYQTLVGAWPFDTSAEPMFRERLRAYVVKALREAKVNTSWLSPDEEYEQAVLQFLDAIFDRRRPFLQTFRTFQARVAELGIYNSLAQLLIKVAAPGVPDFYQGTELWDLSLVDPDNRRPVDYALRQRAVEEILADRDDGLLAATLLERRTDGCVKLFVAQRALEARAGLREVFEQGRYVPLGVVGARRDHVFAFARRHEGRIAIACVPRLVAALVPAADRPPVGSDVWGDTRIELPISSEAGPLRDVFTGATIQTPESDSGAAVDAATLFARFPVALLVRSGPAGRGRDAGV